MSKKTLRTDKTCLNCKYVVENKFCPNCGQENSDTRKTFHHIFIHFFEDLTHYENAFWRTIKNLLFRPAALTKEYLSGKRLSYLAPVRLYIFISFLTFFILAIIPGKNIKDEILKNARKNDYKNSGLLVVTDDDTIVKPDENEYVPKNYDTISKEEIEIKKLLDSKKISDSAKIKLKEILEIADKNKKINKADFNFGYNTIEELDKAKADGIEDGLSYWFLKKTIQVKDNNTKEEVIEKCIESAKHNFPKVLLIYMPLFAFFLLLFHGKKRWYYFDHGIFTLHYFSFLLSIYLIVFATTSLLELLDDNLLITYLIKILKFGGYGWMFYYFFPAHHRFYGETRWISFVKSMFLFWINMFFIIVILLVFSLYTLISIH